MSKPDPEFKGIIGRTIKDSESWWPEPAKAPEGCPNVVFIILDDVGFSQLGCYGSQIETPNMDRLASNGLPTITFTPPLFVLQPAPVF